MHPLVQNNDGWLSFFLVYLSSTNLGLTPPGTYNRNASVSDAYRGSNSLGTRTLDRYTRAGLPECVVSTMSGPPPETKDTHSIPGNKLKFLTPPGKKPGTLSTTPRQRIRMTVYEVKVRRPIKILHNLVSVIKR